MLSAILDWVVVAIPVIVGFMAWVLPIPQATGTHRFILFIGCVIFSGLIYWQQHEAREERKRELGNLPTKQDIAKLPTAADIVKEFQRIAPGAVNQAPWGMTDEQFLKLSQRLTPYAAFSPEKGDLITSVLGDQDSMKFAQRLSAAFRAAHWKGVEGSGFAQSIFNAPVEGVIIQIRDKEDRPPGLSEFVLTLRESGIEPTGQLMPDAIPRDEFRIIVGSRPSK